MMLFPFFLFFILNNYIYSSASSNSNNNNVYCPSLFVNDHSDNIFAYPIDIYQNNREAIENETIYNCISTDRSFPSIHRCSYKYFCPLYKENLQLAKELMTWNSSNSLCYFKNRQKTQQLDYRASNIVIIGGSIPQGQGTLGCCCSTIQPTKNMECPITSICGDEPHLLKVAHQLSYHCRWAAHFERFMRLKYSNLQFQTIYKGASNSGGMASRILLELNERKIEINGDSIVIIDISVNDGYYIMRGMYDSLYTIQEGMERLIRSILYHSTDHLLPTLILLEMYPITDAYSPIYQNLSRHYGAYLFSYRHMISSNFVATNQADILPYLNFYQNQKRNQHPPWHVMMLYADLISNLVHSAIVEKQCPTIEHIENNINNINNNINNNNVTDEIPDPLYKKKVFMCTTYEPNILSYYFDKNTLSYSILSTFTISPINSWIWAADSSNKHGLISKFKSNDVDYSHELKFSLVDLIKDNEKYMIMLEYLKTYKNAGVIEMSICENYIITIDSLWSNFDENFSSISEEIKVEFHSNLVKTACKEIDPYLKIQHYIVDDRKVPLVAEARTFEQKFKILSLNVCRGVYSVPH